MLSCNRHAVTSIAMQANLKRKRDEIGEEKENAIRTRVKIDLDVKEQEEQAKQDAKTQVSCTLLVLYCIVPCSGCSTGMRRMFSRHTTSPLGNICHT